MKRLLIISILIVSAQFLIGQNIPFDKTNFSDKEGLKAALKNIQEGDAFYFSNIYSKALEKFSEANTFNPKNAELNSKIGDCYLHTGEYKKAQNSLEKAYQLNPDMDGFFLYLLGKTYHVNNNFESAIDLYKKAKSKGSKLNSSALESASKKIEECEFGKDLVASSVKVIITNVGNLINSTNHEYVPVITADESEMFFTSRRENTTGGKRDYAIDDYYEDIYYSTKEKDAWSEAVNIGSPINSEFHDATVGLSIDGQKLFIYRDNAKGDGNILVTERTGNSWSDPEELPSPINSKHQETSACFSYTGKTIYFVSDRPGGFGGKDIYKSDIDEKGKWGDAQNLGATINTAFDEDAIFLHADGKTLYFSSKGHQTMGGYDIFKSVNEKNKWSTPVNLGYPINSADDDVCFVLAANGKYGYYTSEKAEGQGKKDIYKLTFEVKDDKPRLTLLKGIVYDSKSKELLSAQIEIFDNTENKLVSAYHSNSATGKYIVSLPAGHDYGISVRKEGYLFYSQNINIPDTAAFQEIKKDIGLDKIETGKKVVLMNIFYDYNKSSLRASSFNELDKVVELLNKNPKMKVELGAHSDSRGSDAYNLKLSQDRAQSCVDYLTSKGINKARLNAKGYGESKPIISETDINNLKTDEEKEKAHQQNRRTEFKILEH
jgi:outer membrane protein OmpA-like peptidoglycan-associated protein